MKASVFLLKLFCFLSVLLSINLCINHFTHIKVFNLSMNSLKDREFSKYQDTLDFLFMGDSHIQNAVNPGYLQNAYNYASSYENYAQSYFKLKKLIEKNIKPAYIIINADPSSFSSFRLQRFKYDYYWKNYLDYFELAKITGNIDFIYKHFAGRYFAHAGEYDAFYKVFFQKLDLKEKVYKGFKPRFGNILFSMNLDTGAAKTAEKYFRGHNHKDPVLAHYLKKIAELCYREKIGLILIRLPMLKEYVAHVEHIVPLEEVYSLFDEISRAYSGLEIWNYRDIFHQSPECFHNPDHLNIDGARIFSKILAERLAELKL
jgi:hypothetical protein